MAHPANASPSKRTAGIGDVDLRILIALNRFGHLTAAQVARLFYPNMEPKWALREAQRRLHNLEKQGAVLRLRALPTPKYGSAPHVFTLDRRGRQLLERLGFDVPAYFRPSEEHEKAWNPLYMPHDIAVVDVLLLAEQLCNRFPKYKTLALETHRQLKQRRLKVSIKDPKGSRPDRVKAVIPDAWLQLETGEEGPVSIALELDRDSEEQKSWRRKVAGLCALVSQPQPTQLSLYGQEFGAQTLDIAVVTNSDARREELRRWTRDELAYRGLLEHEVAQIFLFTSANPVKTNASDFFFAPVWHDLTNGEPFSLLDAPDVFGRRTPPPLDDPFAQRGLEPRNVRPLQ